MRIYRANPQFTDICLTYFKLVLGSLLFSKRCLGAGIWQQTSTCEATQLTRDQGQQNTNSASGVVNCSAEINPIQRHLG